MTQDIKQLIETKDPRLKDALAEVTDHLKLIDLAQLATRNEDSASLSLILTHAAACGLDPNTYPIVASLYSLGYFNEIKVYIQNGWNDYTYDPLCMHSLMQHATDTQIQEIIDLIPADARKNNAGNILLSAAQFGRTDVICHFAEKYGVLREDGEAVFRHAVLQRPDMLPRLKTAGIFYTDEAFAPSLLQMAVEMSYPESLSTLLTLGVSPDGLIDGQPALFYFAINDKLDAVQTLLEHGADIYAGNGCFIFYINHQNADAEIRDVGEKYLAEAETRHAQNTDGTWLSVIKSGKFSESISALKQVDKKISAETLSDLCLLLLEARGEDIMLADTMLWQNPATELPQICGRLSPARRKAFEQQANEELSVLKSREAGTHLRKTAGKRFRIPRS